MRWDCDTEKESGCHPSCVVHEPDLEPLQTLFDDLASSWEREGAGGDEQHEACWDDPREGGTSSTVHCGVDCDERCDGAEHCEGCAASEASFGVDGVGSEDQGETDGAGAEVDEQEPCGADELLELPAEEREDGHVRDDVPPAVFVGEDVGEQPPQLPIGEVGGAGLQRLKKPRRCLPDPDDHE